VERIYAAGTPDTKRRYGGGFPHVTVTKPKSLELPPGHPKLKSNDIVKDVAKQWNTMSPEAKVAATDSSLEELVSLREAADTKPKIAPVHVLNDVSVTMAKINREVRPRNVAKIQSVCLMTHPTAGCPTCPHRLRNHFVWSPVKH
jgi:hypothetical protein